MDIDKREKKDGGLGIMTSLYTCKSPEKLKDLRKLEAIHFWKGVKLKQPKAKLKLNGENSPSRSKDIGLREAKLDPGIFKVKRRERIIINKVIEGSNSRGRTPGSESDEQEGSERTYN